MPQLALGSEERAAAGGENRDTGRPRPALFLALGRKEVPPSIDVAGHRYRLANLLKHDSWAATAIYDRESSPSDRIVCKFNRQQPILGIPARWLGHWLAAREADRIERLADVDAIPAGCGPVSIDGQTQRHAVAHVYLEGEPLRSGQAMPPVFFEQLGAILHELHRRQIAYVDLHKPENIIVGTDGRPYLIDFQISFVPPPGRLGRSWPMRAIFNMLAESDLYHIRKHQLSASRRSMSREEYDSGVKRPWWIAMHRVGAVPLRKARRRLLVMLSIRRGRGRSVSEHAPEHAVQLKMQHIAAQQKNSGETPDDQGSRRVA